MVQKWVKKSKGLPSPAIGCANVPYQYAKVSAAVKQVLGAQIGDKPAGAVLHSILLAIYCLYSFWRSKVYLSDPASCCTQECSAKFCTGLGELGYIGLLVIMVSS